MIATTFSTDELQAVADALGREVDIAWLKTAFMTYGYMTLADVGQELAFVEAELEHAGGRGVELADKVDALRAVGEVLHVRFNEMMDALVGEDRFNEMMDGEDT